MAAIRKEDGRVVKELRVKRKRGGTVREKRRSRGKRRGKTLTVDKRLWKMEG